MILSLPALMLACSLHSDQPLLLAVARSFSRANPYMTRNVSVDVLNGQDEPLVRVAATSESTARQAIARILEARGEPVIGLLPSRPAWAEAVGRSPTQLLMPCENIAIASAYVSAFDYDCRHTAEQSSSPARRACTLTRYGKTVGLPGLLQVVLSALKVGIPASTGQFAVAEASFRSLGLPLPSAQDEQRTLAGQ